MNVAVLLRLPSIAEPEAAPGYGSDMVDAMVRRNFVRMAVSILLALALCVTVGWLREAYGWTSTTMVAWFSLFTAFVLCILCVWALLRVLWLNLLLYQVARDLLHPGFAALHADIAAAVSQLERAKLLRRLIEPCRSLASFRGGPSFARWWFGRLANRLETASQDPDNARRLLDAGAVATLPADPGWRSFAQFCLTGQLFIGIIGTFLGLLGVFRPEVFKPLMTSISASGGNEFIDSLEHLLQSFGLAFGASLVAYLAYLFGRFTADMVDDAHDEVVSFLTTEILGGVLLVVTPLQVSMRVELSAEAVSQLDKPVQGLAAATLKGEEQLSALQKLTDRFEAHAGVFQKATDRVAALVGNINTLLKEGRQEWQRASGAWSKQTEAFKRQTEAFQKASEPFSEAVKAYSTAVNDAVKRTEAAANSSISSWQTGLTETHREIRTGLAETHREIRKGIEDGIRAYGTAVNKTIQDADASARKVAKTWQDGADLANKAITEAINNVTATWYTNNSLMAEKLRTETGAFASALKDLNTEMSATLRPFAEIGDMVARATKVIDDGHQQLIRSVQQATAASEQSIQRLVSIMQARAAMFDKDVTEQTQAVKEFRNALNHLAATLTSVHKPLLGDGKTGDLVTVLRRLDDTVSRAGLTYRQ